MANSQLPNATSVVSDCFQSGHFCGGPRAGLVLPHCLQNLSQGQNVCFRNEHSIRAGIMRGRFVGVVVPVVCHWLPLHMKLETEFCLTLVCPSPHGGLTNAADDLRGLTHVVITFAVDNVGGRAARCSGSRFHRRRMSLLQRKVTRKILKCFRALSALLLALEAEDALTGSPSAFQSQMEGSGATSEEWRSDASGFYE